ncbi:3-hydroxyacyl-CoA dehydrogenase [Maribacter sp. PR1]|uniref:3-hydroxyacyl-CoA dehydrogenase n=1 Tax=Maribacter cobaltidurans TaxID=1178778 RepID=A0ABU7IUJ3_9FLAO|nr:MULTISPECIES: 3-hydroxyacyl-CoA dehydrogenase [Maribacter]MDC6389235.1 3-hydroxyacyl-CoA dehydrogenase [Maribacter sp. PR1]MEE1976622.1 3-hydroxyacyl-CoA dehydrogenase [Maribacter cobaltidurans]
MNIKDKTFLITGGASGLGAAVAKMIVDHGGHVLLIDLKEKEGNSLAKKLGPSAIFKKADVTDEDSVRSAISEGVKKFGALHGTVSCAGIGPAQRVLGKEGLHELDSFTKVIQVNLIGTFNVLRLAADVIQNNEPGESGERGIIVNTASVAAFDGQIGQAAYSASKGGIVAMTLPIAREFARFGIRVMTIAPGIFETPMLEGLPEDAKMSLGQQIPFPSRLGKPEEYASLVKQIIENQMLNGEVIRLDGAIRMTAK